MAFGPHGESILYTIETVVGGRYAVTGYAWAGVPTDAPSKEAHYLCLSNHPEVTGVSSVSRWSAGSKEMTWPEWVEHRRQNAPAANYVYIKGLYAASNPARPTAADTWTSITQHLAAPYDLRTTDATEDAGAARPEERAPQIFQGYVNVKRDGLSVGTVIVMFTSDPTYSVEVWTTGDDRDQVPQNRYGFPRNFGSSMELSNMVGYASGARFTRAVATNAWANTWNTVRAGASPMRHMILLERRWDGFID